DQTDVADATFDHFQGQGTSDATGGPGDQCDFTLQVHNVTFVLVVNQSHALPTPADNWHLTANLIRVNQICASAQLFGVLRAWFIPLSRLVETLGRRAKEIARGSADRLRWPQLLTGKLLSG